jgi:hypothetical protein
MIYELMIFVSEMSGKKEFAGSKMLPTEAACMAEGSALSRALKEKAGDGLTVEFRCEPRPDDFERGSDGKPSSRSTTGARPAPVPARPPAKPAAQGLAQNAQIERAVRNRLSDPGSAKFKDHRPFRTKSDGDQVACVMVNAKNRMGGYAGFKPYLVYKMRSGSTIAIEGFVNCSLSLETEN